MRSAPFILCILIFFGLVSLAMFTSPQWLPFVRTIGVKEQPPLTVDEAAAMGFSREGYGRVQTRVRLHEERLSRGTSTPAPPVATEAARPD